MTASQLFDGITFDQARDGDRLSRQLGIVKRVMLDYQEHSLMELATAAGCSTSSASARLRDLRKPHFGGYRILKRCAGRGVWLYRMEPKS